MEVSGRKEDWIQSEGKENKIYCDSCGLDGHHVTADGYCIDCKEYLCAACYSVHRRPAVWRHHQLLDAQAMPKTKPPTKVIDACTDICLKHTGKIIEYFCKEHETFGCSACMTTVHRSCTKVEYIPEVAATFDTSKELTELQTNLKELFQSNEKNKYDICSKSKAVTLQSERAKAQIKTLRTEFIELFDRLEKKIDKSVDDIKSSDEAKMTKLANKTDTISNELKNYITEMETKLNERRMCQLFIEAKRLKESIGKLRKDITSIAENGSINRYNFEPDPVIINMKQKLRAIGILKILDKHAKITHFVDDINVKAADEKVKCVITGIELLSENQLVVVDNNNRCVKLLDAEQKKITSIYRTGENFAEKPFDVTKVEDVQIAVTYPSERKIRYLTISDARKTKFNRAIDATGECHGIACSGNNLIVSFNEPPVVKILTMDGKVIKTIEGNFQYPEYVAVNHYSNMIYISNCNALASGSVTCVTNEGKLNAVGECDHMRGIRGIICDKTGSVFVCCCFKDSILQLSEDCKVLQVLLNYSDGIRNPKCIAKSEQNTLYIGHNDNKIKMFKLY